MIPGKTSRDSWAVGSKISAAHLNEMQDAGIRANNIFGGEGISIEENEYGFIIHQSGDRARVMIFYAQIDEYDAGTAGYQWKEVRLNDDRDAWEVHPYARTSYDEYADGDLRFGTAKSLDFNAELITEADPGPHVVLMEISFDADNTPAPKFQLKKHNAFGTISVSGQSNVVADGEADQLTFVAGSNVTITTDATADSVTIAANAAAGGDAYKTIDVSGQTSIAASTVEDTLTIVAAGNITLTTAADQLTITGTGAALAYKTFSPRQNADNDVLVSGQSNVVADAADDLLKLVQGNGINLDTSTDTIKILNTGAAPADSVYSSVFASPTYKTTLQGGNYEAGLDSTGYDLQGGDAGKGVKFDVITRINWDKEESDDLVCYFRELTFDAGGRLTDVSGETLYKIADTSEC